MQNVTVKREDLLSKVQTNRDAHRDLFIKAQVGYRAAVIAELDKMLSEARDNKPIRRSIQLPEPMDRTQDYDRVIAMLKMSADDEVKLEAHEFDQYVLDNWNWKAMAAFTNNSYITAQ